jgi:mono/diheme cytochrome c family protein
MLPSRPDNGAAALSFPAARGNLLASAALRMGVSMTIGTCRRPTAGGVMLSLSLLLSGCAGPIVAPTAGATAAIDPVDRSINQDYVTQVRPIFATSCLHCHGAGSALPWYHALPGVRAIIDDDIARARTSVDMSHDFPFGGRGAARERLAAIGDVLDDGSMPPLRYRLVHWGARLDDAQRRAVRAWLERTQRALPTR